MSKLAKLVQLFAEGTEVTIPTPSGDPVVLWVSKLNPFQEEQANQAGRIARARAMMAVKEVGTPEYTLFESSMGQLTDAAIVESIVQNKTSELYIRADREMRHHEDWRERLELLENSEGKMRPEEEELLTKIQQEVAEHLTKRFGELEADLREELEGLTPEALRQTFRDTHLDQVGMNTFGQERQRQVIYMSLRECEASPPGEDGKWDHSACDHSAKFLDDPEDVDELPDVVWREARDAYQNLVLPANLARFTGALPSSSDSPEPSDSEEESTPSGQVETPSEPGTTSS